MLPCREVASVLTPLKAFKGEAETCDLLVDNFGDERLPPSDFVCLHMAL